MLLSLSHLSLFHFPWCSSANVSSYPPIYSLIHLFIILWLKNYQQKIFLYSCKQDYREKNKTYFDKNSCGLPMTEEPNSCILAAIISQEGDLGSAFRRTPAGAHITCQESDFHDEGSPTSRMLREVDLTSRELRVLSRYLIRIIIIITVISIIIIIISIMT